jgi:cellulose synthase/poly-beta-1,6-N-acetylglucosamine synthase-like glycosyltransferase
MSEVQEPITVFTDANVFFEPDAIAELVRGFSNPRVGVVCGDLLLQERKRNNPDTLYWWLERFLKRVEGRIGGLLGANGAIYAMRTSLFRPLPADTIIDDFVIAMRVATLGSALVYQPFARAREDVPERIEDEFRRRVRIGTGNYQALFRYPEFLYRTSPVRVFTYISHKVLRWFAPHLLATMLITSMLLSARPVYAIAFWAQLVFYASALLVLLLRRVVRVPPLFLVPAFLVSLNAAFTVAFWSYLTTETHGEWSRTERNTSKRQEP